MLFKIYNNIIDKKKENILIYSQYSDDYFHIYSTLIELSKIISLHSKKYNILFINTVKSEYLKQIIPNYINIDKSYFNNNLKSKFVRKKEDENSNEKNTGIIKDCLKKSFSKLGVKKIKYVFFDSYNLPNSPHISKKENVILNNLLNEWFDYIGNDKELLKIINKNIKLKQNKLLFNTLMFSVISESILNSIFLIDSFNIEHIYPIVIDPANVHNIFPDYIKVTPLYFTNDKRGTRNFHKFNINQLQFFSYNKPKIKKNKMLLFAGTIFYNKGNRMSKWEQFLENLNVNNSYFYIPLKINGGKKTIKKSSFFEKINKKKDNEKYIKLSEEILNNKYWKNGVSSIALKKILQYFKYTLVLSCVSTYDSVNFRIHEAMHYDILPLIDKDYDPEFLYLSEELQYKIVVENHKDIESKIKYYENNPDEYKNVLNAIKKEIDYSDNKEYIYNNTIQYLTEYGFKF